MKLVMKLVSQKYRRGFSLSELSIVIAIIAVVMGSAISVAITQDSTTRFTQTDNKLATIAETLGAYISTNKRLPCPADGTLAMDAAHFGEEVSTAGSVCDTSTSGFKANFSVNGAGSVPVYIGMIPVTALGLPNSYAVDGWDRRFMYIVDKNATIAASTYTTCSGACLRAITTGAITVKDVNGNNRTGGEGAVVAIISYGKNGHGAFPKNGTTGGATRFSAYKDASVPPDESINSFLNADATNNGTILNGDGTVIQKATSSTFDDRVIFLTKMQAVYAAGGKIYKDSECSLAKAVVDAQAGNACESAGSNCTSFATQINNRCL